MSLLDIFKKKYNLKYTISFDQEIPKASDEEDGEVKYLDYVNAKDISNDIKVKGTKYYMAHSIISNNTSDFIKFTVYFRCRYDKKGKDYIREDLKILVQKAFGIYSYNAKTINCDIDLENLLKDHIDFRRVRKIGVGNGNPIPVVLPRKSHGQRSLGATVHGVTKRQTRLSV